MGFQDSSWNICVSLVALAASFFRYRLEKQKKSGGKHTHVTAVGVGYKNCPQLWRMQLKITKNNCYLTLLRHDKAILGVLGGGGARRERRTSVRYT